MEIIPAIYISDGQAVSLYKGIDAKDKTVYDKTPLKIAALFTKKGLNKIHLVDLDGSFQNRIINKESIREITSKVKAEIQVAGGIRTITEIEELFNFGVKRVILGYGAKPIFQEALNKFGEDRIFGGIKSKRNIVDTDVPLEEPLEVLHAGEEYKELGIKNIIFKDLEAEGTLIPNFDEVDRLISFLGLNLYLSGGISKDSHLKISKQIGVRGVIIGRAFMEGMLGIGESLNIANG